MCSYGTIHSGKIDDETIEGLYAKFRAESQYEESLKIFERRNSLNNAAVLHQELAQLKYRLEEYKEAYEHIEKVCDYYSDIGTLLYPANINQQKGRILFQQKLQAPCKYKYLFSTVPT